MSSGFVTHLFVSFRILFFFVPGAHALVYRAFRIEHPLFRLPF